jgi:hypothetical protein
MEKSPINCQKSPQLPTIRRSPKQSHITPMTPTLDFIFWGLIVDSLSNLQQIIMMIMTCPK